ncbi:unnamed protein product [Hydatigera taeniaeformis]|uniref:Nitrogen permease regulator 2 n=1 Tax=Hydatigena taeniaeformis TaxID=6205 RepID=A0A0R3X4I1_HYDTA|nr:unnamed protein product [Hydatigera taeniaeformis]
MLVIALYIPLAAVKALELAAVIYCTFENVQGSMIDCQYPDGYISSENFKLIAHAVIPRADLTDQPIVIAEFGHFIIGFPQRIEGTQYSRNTLLFNLCFVVHSRDIQWQHCDLTGQDFPLDHENLSNGLQPALQSAYELTVRKINRYLAYMEEENAALSRDTIKRAVDGSEEILIHRFLRQIFTDLREKGLCVTSLSDDLPPLYLIFAPRAVNNSVSTCFIPTEAELPADLCTPTDGPEETGDSEAPIGGSDVWRWVPSVLEDSTTAVTDATIFVRVRPILTSLGNHLIYVLEPQDDDNLSTSFWETRDLVSSRLLPLVNGQRTVAQVAGLANVDRSIARLCLTQLAQLGVVHVVSAPIFFHSSITGNNICSNDGELFAVPGYVGLPRLLRLAVDVKLRDACFESVLSLATKRRRLHITDPHGLVMKILQVYSKLCASPYLNLAFLLASTQSFVELQLPPCFHSNATRSSTLPCLNLLCLVQFGEVNNLIHRLHCYPISEALSPMASNANSNAEVRAWNLLQDRMMDGVQSVDDLVYEASAWAVKSSLLKPTNHLNDGRSCDRQTASAKTTTLPDAVVAFTAKLLKEKQETDDNAAGRRHNTILSETNRAEGFSSESASVPMNSGRKNNPYRPPEDVEARLKLIARRTLPTFTDSNDSFKFPSRQSKVKFLKACMQEFNHTIPSSFLHELEDLKGVKDYFLKAVEPEDKLIAMLEEHSRLSNLPQNLVIQVDPIRYNPDDKSFFSTSPFPGRSTIVSGLDTSKKYPSHKASKSRRLWIDAEDLV